MQKSRSIRAAVIGGICAVTSSAVSAQSGTEANSSLYGLEEVVVTAQKRSESAQKVPISMSAISGEALQERGIVDVESIAKEVPSISLKSSGPGQTEISMRGLSSSGGKSPVVGFYLDETVLSPPSGAIQGKVVVDPDLYDMHHVEILRGPQGSLYGASSMGGTIKLVTNQPDPQGFDASINATSSLTKDGGLNWGQSGMVNIPLVQDKLALRVVETFKRQSGWIDRVVLNDFPLEQDFGAPGGPPGGLIRGSVLSAPVSQRHEDVNDVRLEGVRASLLYQATDRLSITPGFFYQRISQDGASQYDSPPATQQAHYQPFDIAEPFSDSFRIYSLTVKYDFDHFQLISATGRWDRTQRIFQDISEPLQWAFGVPDYGFAGPASIRNFDETRQFSQELRLASTGTGPFQWIVGAFTDDFKYTTQALSTSESLLANGLPTSTVFRADGPASLDQNAVFGEVSYQFLDRFKATVGLRWYSYEGESRLTQSGIVSTGSDDAVTTNTTSKHDGVNPKFNLAYTLSDDVLLYATAAKGFRPGAGNSAVPVSGPVQCLTGPGNLESVGLTQSPAQYDPDEIWSFEIGEKARMLDGRLTVNSSLYHVKWTGVQQKVTLACGFIYTDNAADADIYGAEIELAANLGRGWMITQTAGYTESEFLDTVLSTDTVKGQKVTNIPDWTSSTSVMYETPLGANYTFNARVTSSYVGEMEDITFTRNTLPSYNLVGLRFGLLSQSWSAYLFAENLTDERAALTNNSALSLDIPTLNRVATNRPRTIGLSVDLRF